MSTPERSAWVIAVIGVALAACSAPEGKLPNQVITALESAYNRNDAAAAAALFVDDAEILPEVGQSVRGRAEIDAFFREQVAQETAFDTDSVEQIVRNDIAIDQGTYRVRNVVTGKDVEMGKYLAIWKNVGGGWKIYRLMYNTDVAAKASMTVAEDEAAAETPVPN
ncbi:MAG TPA: nuclear transport factor 2 family protein [Steroidobacteraceae bacterium]|nr:nuclear transport factor 2 family protein [Steroidobacteraceae bacterium]